MITVSVARPRKGEQADEMYPVGKDVILFLDQVQTTCRELSASFDVPKHRLDDEEKEIHKIIKKQASDDKTTVNL